MVEISSIGGNGDHQVALRDRVEGVLSTGFIDLMKQGQGYLKDTTGGPGVADVMKLFAQSDLVFCSMPQGAKEIKVDEQVDKFLKDELGVKDKYMQGSKVTIELEKAKYKDFPGAPQLWFDKKVSFDIKKDGDKIELNDIDGLMVNPGDYIPWANVTNATFERSKEGKCTAKVTGGRLGVSVTREIEIPAEVYKMIEKTADDNLKK